MRRLVPLLAVLVLAGCGNDEPNPEVQVRETLQAFAESVEQRDYQTLCDEVFDPDLLEGLVQRGLPCERALQIAFEGLESPRLTVGQVRVEDGEATAEIKTAAAGQPPSSDQIQLVEVEGDWRVTALGGPTQPPTEQETPEVSPEPSPEPAEQDQG